MFIEHLFQGPESKTENLQSLVVYDPPSNSQILKEPGFLNPTVPTIIHFPSTQAAEAINSSDSIRSYLYIDQHPGFANPFSPNYNKPASRIAYTRTLKILRDNLGPKLDLEKVSSLKDTF